MSDEEVNQPQEAQKESQLNSAGQGNAAPSATEPAQDQNTPVSQVSNPAVEPAQDSSIPPAQPDPVAIPDPSTQVPLELNAPEPVVVPEQKEQQDSNIEVQGASDTVELIPTVEVENAASPSKIETTSEEQRAELKIVEKIVEVEKPISQAQKDQIYHEKLDEGLAQANQAKHAEYEKHLQEIVEFIRSKATLVTNQEIEEGLKIADTTVTDRLNVLIERRIVLRVGEGQSARYRLTAVV